MLDPYSSGVPTKTSVSDVRVVFLTPNLRLVEIQQTCPGNNCVVVSFVRALQLAVVLNPAW